MASISLSSSPIKMHGPGKLTTITPNLSLAATSFASSQFTDASSAFNAVSRAVSQYGQGEGYHDYVLIFNRSSGSARVHYLMVHPTKRGRMLPKMNFISMTKVKELAGYRVVVLNNFLYIIGGRNLESGSILNHCYRFDPRNNQWVRLANLNKARCRHTANALDGLIYVTGENLLSIYTETEMSSFWWNFHHWLHWKLSKWQLPVQPVIKISSKWRHFRFSVQSIGYYVAMVA